MNCPECFGFDDEHATWCSRCKTYPINWFVITIAVLLAWALFIFVGCAEAPKRMLASTPRKMRVTFYHRFEDRFGSRTASGPRAKEGITVAASPNIPFHTPVEIPRLNGIVGDGNFTVQDRGSAIKGDHLDVYVECSTRREARRRMRELSGLPPWMDVVL